MLLLINSTLGDGQVEKCIYHSELVPSLTHHHLNLVQGNPFNRISPIFPPHIVSKERWESFQGRNWIEWAATRNDWTLVVLRLWKIGNCIKNNRIKRGNTERFVTQKPWNALCVTSSRLCNTILPVSTKALPCCLWNAPTTPTTTVTAPPTSATVAVHIGCRSRSSWQQHWGICHFEIANISIPVYSSVSITCYIKDDLLYSALVLWQSSGPKRLILMGRREERKLGRAICWAMRQSWQRISPPPMSTKHPPADLKGTPYNKLARNLSAFNC